ncbi:hypothetical protein V1264_004750 [Littorina saxatilis]|uniref:Paraneoplastic antigen Ma-like C-terminal domain-containing protein n=1 Tax=Littorina saxatilis TaxID=31220 RepID=A0AAN9B339_9CAEN
MAEKGDAGNGEEGDQAKMADLERRLEKMEATMVENFELREKLAALSEEHQAQMEAVKDKSRPLNIEVQSPAAAPKPKVFTGLAPTGGAETHFSEWEAQTEQLLLNNSVKDPHQQVLGSLKGLACEQAKGCTTAKDILQTLREIFGEVRGPDDLYLAFTELRMERKEQPSAFLLRLWDSLTRINKTTKFPHKNFNCKLYRTFFRGLEASHPLMCLEVRNQFGFPGAAEPELAAVLKAVRMLESGAPPAATPKVSSNNQSVAFKLTDEDLDKLADRLTGRMMAGHQSTNRPPTFNTSNRGAPRGHCWCCGERQGHYARDCPNPPNQAKAEAAEAEQRAQMGRGNANGSLVRGGQRH